MNLLQIASTYLPQEQQPARIYFYLEFFICIKIFLFWTQHSRDVKFDFYVWFKKKSEMQMYKLKLRLLDFNAKLNFF